MQAAVGARNEGGSGLKLIRGAVGAGEAIERPFGANCIMCIVFCRRAA
jgi:hypothetical protein